MITPSLLRAACALPAVILCAATSAQAGNLQVVSPPDETKLFTTEAKFDQDANGGQRGHDLFLRNGDSFSGPSTNQNWSASGTVYDWSISYDGDNANFTLDGKSLDLDIDPDGNWNAFRVIARATDPDRFDSMTTTVVIDTANGMALGAPHIETASLGELNETTLALDDLSTIASLSGTLTFDYVWAAGASGSPNSRFAFNFKALNAVPEPSAALLSAIALAGLASRRR